MMIGTMRIYEMNEKGECIMGKNDRDAEELRSKLLSEVYAGAVAGMPAMILDESRIRMRKNWNELQKNTATDSGKSHG